MSQVAIPAAERVLRRVEVQSPGCWVFTGSLNAADYAVLATLIGAAV